MHMPWGGGHNEYALGNYAGCSNLDSTACDFRQVILVFLNLRFLICQMLEYQSYLTLIRIKYN